MSVNNRTPLPYKTKFFQPTFICLALSWSGFYHKIIFIGNHFLSLLSYHVLKWRETTSLTNKIKIEFIVISVHRSTDFWNRAFVMGQSATSMQLKH